MSVPGSNLLLEALSIIEPQTVRYFRFLSRIANAAGVLASTYEAGVDVEEGSLQAVPLTRYASIGLDLKKKYTSWFVCEEVVGVDRDRSGDLYEFNGRRYEVVTETNWFVQDGWTCVIGIDIGPAVPEVP